MQVKVAARHGHLDEPTQALIRERAEKLLHYFDRLTFIEVTVDLHREKTDGSRRVEIVATAEHDREFVGHADGPDVLAAFGGAADRVKMQITHHKEKLQDHRRDPSHNDAGGR